MFFRAISYRLVLAHRRLEMGAWLWLLLQDKYLRPRLIRIASAIRFS
jgi:hypothetical protein